ncbi:hypothetical protein BN159_7940 [Streptomyces davaonensis JCM 4913]|uniref:Uncharacterized protein n=1 Tax=Streptomyces davaonensis (strain DSM 101723 / JCM 4913 / KCC S-0913 / 768) TaxID=1214101 RepID=K4RGK8_STRDJ|nr:hypothetical protein [Streptomyces davaonensis]CCK32319.1 hypothetical protein BN159_7940 [Streptomyces davaonensis JCM 4913]
MHETSPRPEPAVPVQAPAVRRDQWQAPADGATDRGAEAARSMCAGMTGSARDMCRSMGG